jgi:hypothetical protein
MSNTQHQVLELHLVQAWFKLNKPGQPCIMFRYWDAALGNNSIIYFQNIFERAKIDVCISRDTLSEYIVSDDDAAYIVLDVDASLVHKLVQAVNDYNKWASDLYGWDGTNFFWSRE